MRKVPHCWVFRQATRCCWLSEAYTYGNKPVEWRRGLYWHASSLYGMIWVESSALKPFGKRPLGVFCLVLNV
jgi:hypothetical protein